MKELSIEEKAKRYDESLATARKLYNEAKANGYSSDMEDYETIFPELKESNEEEVRKAMINFFKHEREEGVTVFHYGVNIERMIDWLEKHGEQKPVEWSEEDLSMMGRIRSIIEKYAFSQSAVDVNGELCEKEFIDADNWLKSLKERVQPRQEWSEEDDDDAWLNDIISKAECNLQLNKGEINWLKSLKARYTWKPSDEQMGALLYYTSQSPILSSLYNDLKAIFKV